jgi:hypothetical protein
VPEKMHTNKTEADGLQKQNKRRINRVALVTFKKKGREVVPATLTCALENGRDS